MWRTLLPALLFISFPGCFASSLGHAITDLAFRLDAHVTHRIANQNSAFSPLSISGLLAVFIPGSEGETQTQLLSVLRLWDVDSLDAYRQLYEDLEQSTDNVTLLEIASRIYTRTGMKLSGDYSREIFRYFGTDVRELDFSGNPAACQRSINEWFADKTKGSIDTILQRPVPTDTFMFVLNAVYFKAFWKIPFNVENTKIGKFYTTETEGTNMMMMKLTNVVLNVARDQDKKLTLVEIPYSDSRTSMLILLPDVGKSLGDVMASINGSYLTRKLSRLTRFQVTLTMPRFQLEVGYELSDIVQHMGLEQLFEPGDARLKPMFGSDGYYAQKVLHSVSIDVMENGTEASGTGFSTIGLSSSPTLQINVNRPFAFLIYDATSACVLFMGRLVKPPEDGALLLGDIDGGGQETSDGLMLGGRHQSLLVALCIMYLAAVNRCLM